ncbi:MAG: hypothetical protein AAFU60_16790 [Bacteroidota bacterium]
MSILNKLLFFSLFSISVFSQNTSYQAYYGLVNEAARQAFLENEAKALSLYQRAFAEVPFVHTIQYVKAARVAARERAFDLISAYLLQAIQQGYNPGVIEQPVFKKYRKSSAYTALQSSLAEPLEGLNFDTTYAEVIDSLYYIDQGLLRKNPRLPLRMVDTTLSYSDSLNFACLQAYIQERGFPSEERVGFGAYRQVWVILLHNARLPKNQYIHAFLKEQVDLGAYQPEHYAQVIDQYQAQLTEPLIYYHWDVATDVDRLSEQERMDIDERRASIGLPSLDRIRVVRKGGTVKNQLLW